MNKKAMILSLAVLFLMIFPLVSSQDIILSNSPARPISIAPLTNTSFAIALASGSNISYAIYYTNSTVIKSSTIIVSGVSANARVNARAINSTAFSVAWYDDIRKNMSYQLFSSTGTNLSTSQFVETIGNTLTDFVDLSQAMNGNQFYLCYTNDIGNDADFRNISYSTLGGGTDTIVDSSMAVAQSYAQIVSCNVLSSNRVSYFYNDDPVNDATYRIINTSNSATLSTTVLDSNVGNSGQVRASAMRNMSGMMWYDSSDSNIYFSVYDLANNQIFAPTSIDNNAGTSSRVGIATVKLVNSSLEVFIIAWNDRNADSIEAQVRYSNGTLLFNYTLASNENTTDLFFDIAGRNDFLSMGTCDGQYLFSYKNTSGSTVLRNLYVNGTESNGVCGVSDLINPNGTLLQPVDNLYTNITSVNFTINATDNVGLSNITLYIYNGTALVTTQTQTVTGTGGIFGTVFNFLFNDIFTWFYKVVDTAGNIFTTGNRTIIVDTVYPQLAITYPVDLANYNYVVSNITHIVNETNLANCTFSNGTVTNVITCNSIHYFNASENNNLWYVTATDLVGQSYTRPVNFLVDTVYPLINFSSGTQLNNSLTNSRDLFVNVTINETNFYKIRYVLTNQTSVINDISLFTPITSVLFTNSSDGIYYFNVTIEDIVGHTTTTETRVYTIDTTPPSLIIHSPIATNYTNDTILINITSDGNQVFYTDGGVQEYFGVTYGGYPQGFFNFSAIATDLAGNQNISYVYFFVDSLAPSITYISPTEANNSIKAVNTIRVKVNVIEASLGNITIRLYNSSRDEIASSTNNTSPYFVEFTNMSNGIYYFNVTACDLFSECSNAPTRKVIIDQTLTGSLALSLILNQYPYVDVNVSYPIKVSLKIAGSNVDDANTTMILTNLNGTNLTIPLIFNSTSGYYESLIVFDEVGNFPFTVKANSSSYGYKQENGTFFARSPFYLVVKLFDQKTLDPIINDFSYITAEYKGRALNPILEPFIYPVADNRFVAKSFHSPYINGEANLKLYEPQTDYVFRWFDGRVTYSGEYSAPNITDSYGTNVFLGEQQVQGLNETYQFVLSSFDQHPYRSLLNWGLVVALLLAFIGAIAVFFLMPQYPMISLMVGIIFPIILVAIRLIIWWFWW